MWAGAAAVAVGLYKYEGARGQSLAFSEMLHYDLTPEVAGRITHLSLEVGQSVREGEVVGAIDAREIDEKMAPIKAQVERLEARVKARRARTNGDGDDEADVAVKAALCGASPDRLLLQIDALSTDQAADTSEREVVAGQLGKLRPLLEQRLVTGERLDELSLRQSVLTKRIAGRAKALGRLDECLDLNAEVELQIQRQALTRLERERVRYQIVAPASGAIETVAHRPGEWLSAGTALAEIVVPRPQHVIAYVTDRQVPNIQVGTRATVATRDHEGPTLRGRVIALGPRIEQVPLRLRFIPSVAQWGRLVTIEVEPPGASLPGEIYNASFEK